MLVYTWSMSKFIDQFFSKPLGAFLGSLLFVFIGIIAVFQPGLLAKIIGSFSILFFGIGAMVLLWRMFPKRQQPQYSPWAMTLREIKVSRHKPIDLETTDIWERVGETLNKPFQQVILTKSADAEFAWTLRVSAGQFFRNGEVAEQFSQEIYQSLIRVPGVRGVGRQDDDSWAIDGDCDGETLIKVASLANDLVLKKYELGQLG